jgi:hypothetical protein
VAFAGSMKIENGWVKGVRPDSGHYKPTKQHAVNFLKHLKALGVPFDEFDYWDFAGEKSYDALDILKWNGDVKKLMYEIGKSNRTQKWQRITDLQCARRTWERLRNQNVSIRTLTTERYRPYEQHARQQALLNGTTVAPDDLDYLWHNSYLEVLLDLAMFDGVFRNIFEMVQCPTQTDSLRFRGISYGRGGNATSVASSVDGLSHQQEERM